MIREKQTAADEDGLSIVDGASSGEQSLVWTAPASVKQQTNLGKARLATLQMLAGQGLPDVLDFIGTGSHVKVMMKRPMGEDLSQAVTRGGLRITPFLDIAKQLAVALKALHNRRIPHGHIKPEAVFIEPRTGALTLALHPDSFTCPAGRPSDITGRSLNDIIYTAPEQSGRIETKPDLRADLYALGLVYYELLTGAAPFNAFDEMELVHQHIAIAPRPLCEIRSDLPEPLADVVHKLLEKSPERRYQTALGLLSDLQRCAAAFEIDGTIPPFELGSQDALAAFRVPNRLFGRDREIQHLMDAAERSFDGGVEAILLAGRSGTGKSALFAKLRDLPNRTAQPLIISGKYEEIQSLPYLAILEALREFVMLKLSQGTEELERYRARLIDGLGDNLGIIAEFLPELRLISGDLTETTQSDPMERNQRFRIAIQAFFETMSDADTPVILFLDDLQWAESASITLLEDVFRTAQLSHLLLVGAYRDNARGAKEKVDLLVQAFEDTSVNLETIPVRPLRGADTLALVAAAMNLEDASDVADLARVLHGKAQGNAFHLRRLLEALYQEGAIHFDQDTGRWTWRMDSVTRQVVDADIALLMTERIELLSPAALETIRFAACFGTTTTPKTLKILSDRDEPEIEALLNEACNEGFLEHDIAIKEIYRFSHDMVRDAAYRLTPETERKEIHYKIGSFLLDDIKDLHTDDRLFAALDQFALGAECLRSPPLGRLVIQAVLAAVTRTKSLAAYDTAQRYLSTAADIPAQYGGVDWASEPDVTTRLRRETLEVTYFLSGFDTARPIFEELLENLSSPRKKAQIYQLLVTLHTYRSEYNKALAFGLEGLKLLGVNLSGPLQPKIGQQLILTHLELRKHDVYDFSTLPDMDNEASEQLMEMLMIVSTPAFLTNKDLFVLISLRMFRITLRDGLTSAGIFSIQNYSIVMYIAFKAVDRAYKIGTNLFPLLERRDISPQVRGRLFYTYCVVVAWHFRDYDELRDLLSEGLAHSWKAVDLEYVGYFYYGLLKYTWIGCKPLPELTAELNDLDRYQKRLKHQVLNDITAIYRRAVERLTAGPDHMLWSRTDRILEDQMAGEAAVGSFLTTQMLLTHIYSDWKVVSDLYGKLLAEEDFTTLGPEFVDYHLLSGLCITRTPAGTLNLSERQRSTRMRKHLKALHRLRKNFPTNHSFQYQLLLGEDMRMRGQPVTALQHFAEAVQNAQDQGIWSYAGIGSECAARAAEALGDEELRFEWLGRARDAYATWGATSKTDQLMAEHPDLHEASLQVEAKDTAATLDVSTIFKTSQAILEITDLDTLLKRLLAIAVENAGANKGELFLRRDSEYVLAATADTSRGDVRVTLIKPNQPLRDLSDSQHPKDIVSRVAASKSSLILSDASAAPGFDRDRYVLQKSPKSVFTMPIMGTGEIQGVLHLENALAEGVFTPARQEILTTIMTLAAISLDNALLYARQAEALEMEKRASSELVRVNQLKDEFLANTSHELRTPLNGIIGLADGMIGGANGPLSVEAQGTLDLIVSSGRRLTNLVSDILDFSQMKDGPIEITTVPLDLRTTVDVVFSLLQPHARQAGVTLENNISADTPSVLADEDRLQQILINLVENAIKFAPDGQIVIDSAVVGDRISITVTDNGPGISAENKELIFRGFEQIDASTRRDQGGLGLGLTISKRLVELHGGTLEETGTLGRGARFTFDLAITREQPNTPSTSVSFVSKITEQIETIPTVSDVVLLPSQNMTTTRGGKALLVDDDPVNLQVLENYMALEGFTTRSASDGEAALRIVAEGFEPDIVLLDVMMPRMSGYDVCTRLRQTHSASRLPIIMLTAKNRLEDLRAGFTAGATDYLAKPFSREELSARMHAHLSLTRVSNAYKRFVPVEFLDFLNRESILDIELGDNISRQMTVMFTDIRGFTPIAEQLTPHETFEFLNEYFRRIGPIVQENNGIVAQFLGDGMMALFPGHPRDAAKTAIEIQRELRRMNVDRAALNLPQIGTGVGLHTGDLIMGILGDKYRLNGNVVSDTVNAAARLESLTSQCGVSIAASEAVIDQLPDSLQKQCRRLTRVRMAGKSNAMDVFEIFAGDIVPDLRMKQDTRKQFEKAVDLFRHANFAEAATVFDSLFKANPRDLAAEWMAARATQLQLSGAELNWSGSDTLTRK